jgi:hypothetical protein
MSGSEVSRRFVSTDPIEDLINADPHLRSSVSAAATVPTSLVSTRLAALQSVDAALQQHHQRQELAGQSTLFQIISGGGAADPSFASLQLGSLNSEIPRGPRRASLLGYALSGSERQNRSAIANFLANPQRSQLAGGMSEESLLLRGAGNGATLRSPMRKSL